MRCASAYGKKKCILFDKTRRLGDAQDQNNGLVHRYSTIPGSTRTMYEQASVQVYYQHYHRRSGSMLLIAKHRSQTFKAIIITTALIVPIQYYRY